MKAAVGILGVAAAALLLTACSGGSGDDRSGTPSATPTAIAAGPTSDAAPTIGNLDDTLCAAANDSQATAESLEATANELQTMLQDPTFLTSGDVTALNEWGDTMLALSNDTLGFYKMGAAETDGEDVNKDFVALTAFVTSYTLPLAQMAADAGSPTDFMTGVTETFTDPAVQSALSEVPTAAQNAAAYLADRCGITG